MSNVGDHDDTSSITIDDPIASVTPDEVRLVAGASQEVGVAGAEVGSTITVSSEGIGGVIATSRTG